MLPSTEKMMSSGRITFLNAANLARRGILRNAGRTGGPSAGRQRWGAVPSVVNEARFFREFLAFAQQSGVRYNVIEAFDQPWKRLLEGTVGGYWGIFDGALEPKFPMTGPVVEDARWAFGVGAGLGSILSGSRTSVGAGSP